MEDLKGVFCALWTPTDHSGAILWETLDRHLSFVFDNGVAGLMGLGSTAEFVHLSMPQRRELLLHLGRKCRERGRRLVANVSDIQLRNVLELAVVAKDAGASCIAVLPPWFYAVEQRDLVEFFVQAAERSQMPLALYNYPEVTGKKIELATIRAVAQRVRVEAVKQSGGDFGYHQELLQLGRELGFVVLTGWDARLEEALRLGCTGTISGLANAVPEKLVAIQNNSEKGAASAAETQLLAQIVQEMAPLKFPLNVKSTIAARGFATGELKAPISRETQKTYELVCDRMKALYADNGLSKK